ncbi:MAG: outer membrane beta-barrel protein [Gammaproteobacteria bacterium]
MKMPLTVLLALLAALSSAVHAANYNYILADYTHTGTSYSGESGTGYVVGFSHSVSDKLFVSGEFEHNSLDESYGGGLFVDVVSAQFGYHMAISGSTDLVLAANILHSRDKSDGYSYTPYAVEWGPEAGLRYSMSDHIELDAFVYNNRIINGGFSSSAVSVGVLYNLSNAISVGATYLQSSSFDNTRQWIAELRWNY